jgi:hypothetical protein
MPTRKRCLVPLHLTVAAWIGLSAVLPVVQAQTAAPAPTTPAAEDDEPKVLEPPKLPDPADSVRLAKDDRVWVDKKKKVVYVDGYVSLREGYLEMFACLEGTKEHESVVAVRSRAATVHAGLLAVGAKVGHPASFSPEFRPAAGTEVDVEAHWLDEQGKWQHVRAQEWVLDHTTKKPMTQSWVFAGSGWWTDEKDGKKYYMAEAGDFICVSNFATAMLDIPIESSQSNDALTFVANTKRIPPLGMPVRLVLTPKLDAKDAKAGKGSDAEGSEEGKPGAASKPAAEKSP